MGRGRGGGGGEMRREIIRGGMRERETRTKRRRIILGSLTAGSEGWKISSGKARDSEGAGFTQRAAPVHERAPCKLIYSFILAEK